MTELFPSYFACFPCNTQSIPSSKSLRLTKKSLALGHIAYFQTSPSIIYYNIKKKKTTQKFPGKGVNRFPGKYYREGAGITARRSSSALRNGADRPPWEH